MTPKTTALLAKLSHQIDNCLGPLVPEGPFALVDFPDIRNVGDSAIWLGETNYLARRFNRRPDYVCTLHNLSHDALIKAVPEGPIFVHGGGNFGDIWLGHQIFREMLIERYHDRRIIMLPQSIHFNELARADQTARLIEGHGNVVLMLRDKESLAFAEERFQCETLLCPDMAFAIGEVAAAAKPSFPVLAMLRKDREQAIGSHDLTAWPAMPVEDWISESKIDVSIAKMRGAFSALPSFDPAQIRRNLLQNAAVHRFARGVAQLSRARAVVTDRLHVHIISLLLGKPHAVLDNSYGKISRYMATFSGDNDLSYQASSLADAVDWAQTRASDVTPP